MKPSAAGRPGTAPERWSADAGSRDVVRLDIPPDVQRDRRFDIDVRLVAANRAARGEAVLGLRLLVDGALEWERRTPVAAGETDTLDYHLRRTVPAGRALRLTASSSLRGCQRLALTLVAEEEAPGSA